MNKLWNYEDYVKHLSHENKIVRKWAFNAIENHYPNRYTDEVSKLIDDEDSRLACAAPRYLAGHYAVQHAPAILDSYKNGKENIPSNCASALGRMKYEPALETMTASFTNTSKKLNMETFFGICDYLGSMPESYCRELLITAAMQINESFLLPTIITNLLRHNNPEDISFILDKYFDKKNADWEIDLFQFKHIASALGGGEYFKNRSGLSVGKNFLTNPGKAIDELLQNNAQISLSSSLIDKMAESLKKKQYLEFTSLMMFDAQSIINSRYEKENLPEWLKKMYERDMMCLALLEEFTKRAPIFKDQIFENNSASIVSLIIAAYCAIKEREAYLKALSPDAQKDDLIHALKNTGSFLPMQIRKKIKETLTISDLKQALTEDLMTWGDIQTVRLMGQMGNMEFVPDLIRVINNADSMSYIHGDAITAINALDESADEMILNAVKNQKIDEWAIFSILEYLPYSQSYDLALQAWNDDDNEMDSYELFAYCLRGIGDKRGIEKLQEIFANEDDASYVGDTLECLGLIHNVNIPELPDIAKIRHKEEKMRKIKAKEISELTDRLSNKKKQEATAEKEEAIPFERETPKIGRNAKCPCGSGKKYKKCCLK
ncbi:SEC-C metal-binding domain-containing protein [Desulfobacterales bacterium HSG17]|nr:SEC-C metal-binding domain-containing protein [Desulfobacterales bacterium HSG17]